MSFFLLQDPVQHTILLFLFSQLGSLTVSYFLCFSWPSLFLEITGPVCWMLPVFRRLFSIKGAVIWEFPSSPVVRIPGVHCRRPTFCPLSGNWDLESCVVWPKKKRRRKKKEKLYKGVVTCMHVSSHRWKPLNFIVLIMTFSSFFLIKKNLQK